MSDQNQREQALDPSKSFIVQAPAGSGKTELLTQRFLRLLACVSAPEEILAITFTKKAAAEMRSRIRDALRRAQEEPQPEKAHERKTWTLAQDALKNDRQHNWGLLDNPNRLRVKTIDAFNSLLTRQLPLLSNFGAAPEIMDYPEALYREAVQILLAQLEDKVEWADAIALLLLHLDNDLEKLENLLVQMLSRRDQWLPYIMAHHQQADALRPILEAHLAAVVSDSLYNLKKSFPVQMKTELLSLLSFSRLNLRASKLTSSILATEMLQDLPGTNPADTQAWLGISEILLTKKAEGWRKKADKNLGFPAPSAAKGEEKIRLQDMQRRLKDLISELSTHEDLHNAFIELQQLPAAYYSDSQWEILTALHSVLKMAVAQLKLIFQQYGKIDYPENAQAAMLALGEEEAPTDLALALDYQIKHLLIDEFQDTSNSQYRLLEKLVEQWQEGEDRSLFLVGDPMQSIYRFREAEVGLFIRARQQGIAALSLQPLTLAVNFRSTPEVVNWINQHFKQIMPSFDDIGSGAVSYTPSIASDKYQANQDSLVQLHAFRNATRSMQAEAIVKLIIQVQTSKPHENIAILVRSRNQLEQLIPALKKAEISYQAIDIDPLNSRPVIQDLLALTRALLYPADRVAWLSILRAPWCGLSLADLLLLTGSDQQELLWQGLQQVDIIRRLSPEGRERLERILPILAAQMAEHHREPIHVQVKEMWFLLGGPACLVSEAELEDANTFIQLLKKLDQNSPHLNWQTLEKSILSLYAQPKRQADCRLQIMTIHNAKGLEFDTVILPHLERKLTHNDKTLLSWLERPLLNKRSALLLAPIHAAEAKEDSISAHIRLQDSTKTKYENSRLLYVAATRAKKTLHLFMNLETKDDGEIKNPSGSLLEKLWPAIKSQLVLVNSSATPFEEAENLTPLKRLKRTWINPYTQLTKAERPLHNKLPGFHLVARDATALGIVIHHLLECCARYGLEWWTQKEPSDHEAYIKCLLLENGVLATQLDFNFQKAKMAVENTLADERGRWILFPHQAAGAELALTAILNKKLLRFVIDRTFIDEQSKRWIIDYKTSTANDQRENHAEYHRQLKQYAQAFQSIESHPIHCALYYPLTCVWQEILIV